MTQMRRIFPEDIRSIFGVKTTLKYNLVKSGDFIACRSGAYAGGDGVSECPSAEV